MNIINLEQGSIEWHGMAAIRRMASEFPALLGLSPCAPMVKRGGDNPCAQRTLQGGQL